MKSETNTRPFALSGMAGAAFFFLNLIVEYRYDLFPPASGPLFVANQLGFFVGMIGLLIMLIGLWRARAAGEGRFGRLALGLFIAAWATLILGGFISLFTDAGLILQPIGGLGGLFGRVADGDRRRSGPSLDRLAAVRAVGPGAVHARDDGRSRHLRSDVHHRGDMDGPVVSNQSGVVYSPAATGGMMKLRL